MTARKQQTADDAGQSGRTIEEDLERLEKIADSLEQGEVPIEKALQMYEEGIALSKACMERLQKAELRIRKLSRDLDGKPELSDEEDGGA